MGNEARGLIRNALILAAAVAVSLSAVTVLMLESSPVHAAALPYNEKANAREDLQNALNMARDSNRRVLIVFGANWCQDCRVLNHELIDGATAAVVEKRFVVVKVDVGHFDRNLDFAKLYGDPTGKGIPSVVVVTPKNEVVYETRAGELADARSMGPTAIHDFFEDLAVRPAGY